MNGNFSISLKIGRMKRKRLNVVWIRNVTEMHRVTRVGLDLVIRASKIRLRNYRLFNIWADKMFRLNYTRTCKIPKKRKGLYYILNQIQMTILIEFSYFYETKI